MKTKNSISFLYSYTEQRKEPESIHRPVYGDSVICDHKLTLVLNLTFHFPTIHTKMI